MANIFSNQFFPNVTLAITDANGNPASVDGVPVWASSDETIVSVVPAADGMSAVVSAVAASDNTARITVSADADLGAGVVTITGVSEDIKVDPAPVPMAANLTLTLGAPADKP